MADRARAPDPMTPLPYRVTTAHRDPGDVVRLELAPDGVEIDPPNPGQFCMLYAPGVGEAPISVSGLPCGGVLHHTIREHGAVTQALGRLRVGDPVGVRGPFGRGWPLDDTVDHDLLIVGGGIGLAPLRPIVERAIEDLHPRRIALAVGARQPDRVLFSEDLGEWRRRGVEVEVVVDAASTDWTGHVGVVTDVLPGLLHRPAATLAMVCGPEVMMRVAARHLVDGGVPAEDVHVSIERNMHCGIGHCGHCQLGPLLTCLNGPVLRWSDAEGLLQVRRW